MQFASALNSGLLLRRRERAHGSAALPGSCFRRAGFWRCCAFAGLASVACSAPLRPSGPAPEYERPEYPAWDAGAGAPAVDPFELTGPVQGADSGAAAPEVDAGVPPSTSDAGSTPPSDAGGPPAAVAPKALAPASSPPRSGAAGTPPQSRLKLSVDGEPGAA